VVGYQELLNIVHSFLEITTKTMLHISNQENEEIIKVRYSYIFSFISSQNQKQAKPFCLHTYLYPCKTCVRSIPSSTLQISQNNFHHIWSYKQGNTSSQEEHQTILIPISCFVLGGHAR
jgi:hypothetical protein